MVLDLECFSADSCWSCSLFLVLVAKSLPKLTWQHQNLAPPCLPRVIIHLPLLLYHETNMVLDLRCCVSEFGIERGAGSEQAAAGGHFGGLVAGDCYCGGKMRMGRRNGALLLCVLLSIRPPDQRGSTSSLLYHYTCACAGV